MKKDARRPYGIQKVCKDCDNTVWASRAKRKQARRDKADSEIFAALQAAAVPATPDGLKPHPDKSLYTQPTVHVAQVGADFKVCTDAEKATALPNDNRSPQPLKPMYRFWDDLFAQARKSGSGGITYEAGNLQREKSYVEKLRESQVNSPQSPTVPASTDDHAPLKAVPTYSQMTDASMQDALRQKMLRDGFSEAMIAGACRILPTVLKELKVIDEENDPHLFKKKA